MGQTVNRGGNLAWAKEKGTASRSTGSLCLQLVGLMPFAKARCLRWARSN